MGPVARFHHVNLGILPDQLEAEMAWLVEVLGYRRLATSAELTAMGANWFEADDGSQVHLSPDKEHRPAARAHVAVEIDDVEDVAGRLRARGDEFRTSESPELTVVFCRDPGGNRWELR
jgi:catechol 2,3-dioxygenase-like lactoylglutathione lyase family enzyme